LTKKFFPEVTSANSTMPTTDDNENLLKTIRISKNLFSLTERLPKAAYNSGNGNQDGSPTIKEQKAMHHLEAKK